MHLVLKLGFYGLNLAFCYFYGLLIFANQEFCLNMCTGRKREKKNLLVSLVVAEKTLLLVFFLLVAAYYIPI